MYQDASPNYPNKTIVFVISVLIIALLFAWQGNKGFSLWDEGFLWYGAQRVLAGEVPILDFMSYDPGRYYWSAAIMGIFGDDGMMSLRIAVTIFQALGLFTGLLLIAQSTNNQRKDHQLIYLIVSAVTLAIWMYPRHKLFDVSLSIFLIGILTFLIKSPTPRRYFIAGLVVGLAAVFGRNHGVYGLAGSLGVMIWLSVKRNPGQKYLNGLVLWGIGVAVGFLPVVLMALMIPGFKAAYWESIYFLFEQKATNIPLPVPWPWTINLAAAPGNVIRDGLIGLFFIGALTFSVSAVLWVFRQRLKKKPVPAALVATAFLALPYAHHAFSRADVAHLAQGIFPMLVGCLVIFSTAEPRAKWPLTAVLSAASLWVMFVFQPGWQCQSSQQCVDVEISGSNFRIDPHTANDIALLRQLADQYAPNGQSFIATPYWPGAYALLERKSPMWENYALFSHSAEFENKEIERIRESKPGFAIVLDRALDGRDKMRFRHTHPLIYRYILDNFVPVTNSFRPEIQIYKARNVTQ